MSSPQAPYVPATETVSGGVMRPPWMTTARSFVGLRETPGPASTPTIQQWLASLHAWWHDDATPWCGTFMAHCMQSAGLAIPKAWYRAHDWADWGREAATVWRDPAKRDIPYGAVCVLDRPGGFHVTAYVASVASVPGHAPMFYGLGGNQGDMVRVSAFPVARIVAVRWPSDYPLVDYRGADITSMAHGTASEGEA